jgi:hypothetical protein
MPAKSRAILLIGLVAALAGLFIFLRTNDPTEEQTIPPKASDPRTGQSTATANPDDEALPSKSKARSPTPEVSNAKTLALLQTPIPGPVEFPEQKVLERIEAINEWLEKSGIPREEFHIIVEPRSAERLREKDLHCRDFSATNLHPRLLLAELFGRTALRYRVVNGGVEMHYMGM